MKNTSATPPTAPTDGRVPGEDNAAQSGGHGPVVLPGPRVGSVRPVPDAMEPMVINETDAALVVSGELDAQTAPDLAAAIAKATDRDHLAIDLGEVTFIDSSGLRVLLEAHNDRLAAERSFVLQRPSAAVSRLLEVAGVSDYLVVEAG